MLTDRLYKRYLKENEMDKALSNMNKVEEIFSNIKSKAIDWKAMGWDAQHTQLDFNKPTLKDVFARYFYHFDFCIRSVRSFSKTFYLFEPIRVVPSDIPAFFDAQDIPLEAHASLEGKPFWLR